MNVHTTNYNYPTFENCLFSAVTLTKNADIDKNMNILDMELDFIEKKVSPLLVVDMVKK